MDAKMFKQGLRPKTLQLHKHDVRKATEVGTFSCSYSSYYSWPHSGTASTGKMRGKISGKFF